MKGLNKAARKRAFILIASCVCIILCAVLLMNLEAPPGQTSSEAPIYKPVNASSPAPQPARSPEPVTPPLAAPATAQPEVAAPTPAPPPPPVPESALGPITTADLTTLAVKSLLIPVEGVAATQLRDSYIDGRSEGRVHEAIDIMAPKDTPVLAVTDGIVQKLYQSDKGGIMIFQMDPSGLYVYYYGHLSRYADGLAEGKQVRRGDVIGYVGDTGNAGAGNFHLHFGISKVSAPGKWSGGSPINPYPLFARK